MKLIFNFFKISYLINLTYRFGLLMRLVRDFVTPLSFLILWSALYVNQNEINGFTFSSMISYYIFVKVMERLYSYDPAKVLTREIRTGELSNYLVKPLNYFKYLFGFTFGKRIARVTLTLISVVILFIVFPSFMSLPENIIYFLLSLISIFISIILVFEMSYLLGCLTFWISETDYFRGAVEQLSLILGGLWVPVNFFPKELLQVLEYLPFKYQYYFPAVIFQGKLGISEIVNGLAIELFWIFGLLFLLKFVWGKGIEKYEGYGN